jgi:Ca2+-binding RTX toxin-like protein
VYFLDQPNAGRIVELSPTRLGNANGLSVLDGEFGGNAKTPIGALVGPAGDFNGDGLDDVFVSAGPLDSEHLEAYVIFGQRTDGPEARLTNVVGKPRNGANQGVALERFALPAGPLSMAAAGDLNNDGYDDLLARRGNSETIDAIYLLFGSPLVTTTIAVTAAYAEQEATRFKGVKAGDEAGAGLAGGADFNGDGWVDIAIGAPGAGDGAGLVYVVFGRGGAFEHEVSLKKVAVDVPGYIIQGVPGSRAGVRLAALNDVNGDGRDDLLVMTDAAVADQKTNIHYIVYGQETTASIDLAQVSRGHGGFAIQLAPGKPLGSTGASAGDFNGDGYGDVVLGVSKKGPYGSNFVIFGGDFSAAASAKHRTKLRASNPAASNVLVGNAEDNTLIADSGGDILIGGAGNDTFIMTSEDVARVRGGRGTDTLVIATLDGKLDLSAQPQARFLGIEIIDTRGAGENTISLDERVLRRLPSSLKAPQRDFSLKIVGDATDRVFFNGNCVSTGRIEKGVVVLLIEGMTCP